MALISKGIELFYDYANNMGPGFQTEAPEISSTAYQLINLQEVGELSALGAGTSRDKIEITTLADDKHVYTDGLIADSDMASISFKFLFGKADFSNLQSHAKWEQSSIKTGDKDKLGNWIVRLPDGTKFTMKATISDLKMDSAGVNAALTMSMSLTPYEAITVA